MSDQEQKVFGDYKKRRTRSGRFRATMRKVSTASSLRQPGERGSFRAARARRSRRVRESRPRSLWKRSARERSRWKSSRRTSQCRVPICRVHQGWNRWETFAKSGFSFLTNSDEGPAACVAKFPLNLYLVPHNPCAGSGCGFASAVALSRTAPSCSVLIDRSPRGLTAVEHGATGTV